MSSGITNFNIGKAFEKIEYDDIKNNFVSAFPLNIS